MAFLIGQCCIDQIVQGSSSGGVGLNEIIPFTNVTNLTIAWNGTRKARFGNAASIYIELLGPDGKYRFTPGLEVVPNNISNTTSYAIDFGGLATGRVVIT